MNDSASSARQTRNLLPSLADIVFLGVFLLLTLNADERLLGDADTGYHIRAGEFIVDNLSIPQTDIFSYLNPPLRWTLHEWLAEVIMALVHRAAGMTGLVIFFAFLIALTGYLIFTLLLKQRSNILLVTVATLLVILSSSSNWLARPHVITFVFFVIWYHLLNSYQYRDRKYLIYLPPIMLLWVNLHGGFILGLILLGIYWVGNCVNYLFAPISERHEPLKKIRFLGLVTVACAFATFFNPYGYDSLLFPFRVVQDQFLMDHIVEYLSPNFHLSSVVPFEITLLATIGIFAISGAKLDTIGLMLILLFGHMALFSSRHMPLFAMIAGPIVLRHADLAFNQMEGRVFAAFRSRLDNLARIDQYTTPYIWPLASVLVAVALAKTGVISHDFNAKYVPVAATEFIKKEKIQGNMFNNDEFGDYIIYAAWPKYKVFIDGRTDMYGAVRVKEYIKVSLAQGGWESILEKYNITWVFHDPNSVLSKLLLERQEWKLVYSDNVANIFLKTVPEHDEIINRYISTKPFTKESSYTN
ncbi:MAG: hypothetical protein ACREQ2_03790 [Candidatus Binatia bacterium]